MMVDPLTQDVSEMVMQLEAAVHKLLVEVQVTCLIPQLQRLVRLVLVEMVEPTIALVVEVVGTVVEVVWTVVELVADQVTQQDLTLLLPRAIGVEATVMFDWS